MKELVRRADTIALADMTRVQEAMVQVREKPSLLVPATVRPALFECWTCHRHLAGLDTSLPLAALVAVWINRFGLSEADAADILQSMQHPDYAAKHKFASDLTASLAGLVSLRLKQRRAEAEAEARRREEQQAERDAVRLPDGVTLASLANQWAAGVSG